MNVKINRLIIVVLAAMTMCLSGCGKFKEISVNSVKLESITPQGLAGLNIGIMAEIDNPAMGFTISDITGSLKHSGKVLGRMTMDPVILEPRSVEIYHLDAQVRIDENVSLFELLGMLDKETLKECTVDISVKGTIKGISKRISRTDIPLKNLLERVQQ